MRLIDADALIDDLIDRYCKDCGKRKGIKNGKYRIIYEIGDVPCRACEVDDVKVELEEAPTASRWIPVSERLPYIWDERYLVSLAWGGVGVMEYKSTGFHNYGSFTPVPIESITAWMPLPEPYREVEE